MHTASVCAAEPTFGAEEGVPLFHPDFPRRLPINTRIWSPTRASASRDVEFAAREAIEFALEHALASGRDPVAVSSELVEALRRAIVEAPPVDATYDPLEIWPAVVPLSPSQLATLHNEFLCEEPPFAWDLALPCDRRD